MRLLRRRATGGFTLVEVLVSIVVLSFGMLGIVGVQAFALQSNREARLQSQAVNLARELAEMMRGNNQIGIQSAAADNPYLMAATSPLAAATPSYCLRVGNAVLNYYRHHPTYLLARLASMLRYGFSNRYLTCLFIAE